MNLQDSLLNGSSKGIIKDFSKCISLEKLDLSWNPMLTSLPDEICNLKSLKYLNLSGCYPIDKYIKKSQKLSVWLKKLKEKGCKIK